MKLQDKIRQSNRLVESPYAQEFSPHEIKIFEIAAAGITLEDMNLFKNNSNKRFKLSTSQLAKLLNTSVSTISHEIEKTAMRVMRKFMHLRKINEDHNLEFMIINIIPFAQYQNGVFEFDLNYMVIPYLLEINSNFTEFELKFLLNMSSAYAIKLYKLLIQYKNIKKRVFSLDELKTQFGLIEKYPQYGVFKKFVINTAINQINDKTDLKVEYKEIRVGRKVEELEFRFELKSVVRVIESIPVFDSVIDSVENSESINIKMDLESKLSKNTQRLVDKFTQEKGALYVEATIAYAKKNAKTNFNKYLTDALNNGWAEVEIQQLESNRKAEVLEIIDKKSLIIQKNKEVELANANKSEIEHLMIKLSDNERDKYVQLAQNIYKKYSAKLTEIHCNEENLIYSVYAVSVGRSYNKMLEIYIDKMLNCSLDINHYKS